MSLTKSVAIQILPHYDMSFGLPAYAHEGDAGFDLRSFAEIPVDLAPGEAAQIPCGFCVETPYGYELQLRPRSGLAWSEGLTVLNAPGTVDSGYRGEIKVMLINHGKHFARIEPGTRIAQAVLSPVTRAEFYQVDRLCESERGANGYGSTGVA